MLTCLCVYVTTIVKKSEYEFEKDGVDMLDIGEREERKKA